MLWYKAFHIIFVVTWFSGLFYLPRLFVYHITTTDEAGIARFKVMEKKLYYAIIMPSGILATLFGILVMRYNFSGYLHASWLHWKLAFVGLLWIYHFACGKYLKDFKYDRNRHSERFYRIFNEIPAILLIVIVVLVVVKPF